MQCFVDPASCKTGLSLSIWSKVVYGDDVFEDFYEMNETNHQIIFSTGKKN